MIENKCINGSRRRNQWLKLMNQRLKLINNQWLKIKVFVFEINELMIEVY